MQAMLNLSVCNYKVQKTGPSMNMTWPTFVKFKSTPSLFAHLLYVQ